MDQKSKSAFYPFRSTPEGLQGIIPLFHQLKKPLYYSILLHLAVK